jgi:hypothetical protein
MFKRTHGLSECFRMRDSCHWLEQQTKRPNVTWWFLCVWCRGVRSLGVWDPWGSVGCAGNVALIKEVFITLLAVKAWRRGISTVDGNFEIEVRGIYFDCAAGLNKSGQRPVLVSHEYVTFVVFTAATMKNAIFWNIRTQFMPQMKHITSQIQSPVGNAM